MNEKERNNVQEEEKRVTSDNGKNTSDGHTANNGNADQNSLLRKIGDAIPQRHVPTFLVVMCVVILCGLAFNFYSAFWGSPRLRSQLRQKEQTIETLKKELKEQNEHIDGLFTQETEPLEEGLSLLDDNAPDSVVFGAYVNSVAPSYGGVHLE